MKTSESMKEIAPALVAFQMEVKDPRKDSDNPYFKSKYVELDGLMMAVRPVANKHGLYISQDVTTEMTEAGKTKVWCRTRLTHTSGEFVESDGQFNVAKGNDPQSIGSSETYIRRYDLSAFLGIAWDKDDDGNAASQTGQRQGYQKQQPDPEKKEKPPFTVPYIEGHPTAAQANQLEVMCQYTGHDVSKMKSHYGVANLSEMKFTDFRKCYTRFGMKLIQMGYTQGSDLNWHKPEGGGQ
ncbi:ERF family protein [Acidaminococcus timonensis]|uniref:ERF family protein n=2 Tax=Acidaminococcus timonensis TaxID=1871002 RepID=UPI00307E7510